MKKRQPIDAEEKQVELSMLNSLKAKVDDLYNFTDLLTDLEYAHLSVLIKSEINRINGHRPEGSIRNTKRDMDIARKYFYLNSPSGSDAAVTALSNEYGLSVSSIWKSIERGNELAVTYRQAYKFTPD